MKEKGSVSPEGGGRGGGRAGGGGRVGGEEGSSLPYDHSMSKRKTAALINDNAHPYVRGGCNRIGKRDPYVKRRKKASGCNRRGKTHPGVIEPGYIRM